MKFFSRRQFAIFLFGIALLQISVQHTGKDFAVEAFGETPVVGDWLTYDNLEEGISVEYPETWQQRNAGYKAVTGFYSPLEEGDTFSENVVIGKDLVQESMTLDEYLDWKLSEFKKITPDFEILSMDETLLSGFKLYN